jgi:hypothetical protein
LWKLGTAALLVALLIAALGGAAYLWARNRRTGETLTAQQSAQAARSGGALWACAVRAALDAEITALGIPTYHRQTSTTAWSQLLRFVTVGEPSGLLRIDQHIATLILGNDTQQIPLGELRGVELRGERQHPVCVLYGTQDHPPVVLDDEDGRAGDALLATLGYLGVAVGDSRFA